VNVSYNEYHVKKVNFIVGGSVDYKNKKHSLVMGFCVRNNDFSHFLIDEQPESNLDNRLFVTSNIFEDNGIYYNHKLLNYKEYCDYQGMINAPIMSFKEYVQFVLKKQYRKFIFII